MRRRSRRIGSLISFETSVTLGALVIPAGMVAFVAWADYIKSKSPDCPGVIFGNVYQCMAYQATQSDHQRCLFAEAKKMERLAVYGPVFSDLDACGAKLGEENCLAMEVEGKDMALPKPFGMYFSAYYLDEGSDNKQLQELPVYRDHQGYLYLAGGYRMKKLSIPPDVNALDAPMESECTVTGSRWGHYNANGSSQSAKRGGFGHLSRFSGGT